MKETDQNGRCFCGAVRYTIRAPSTWCAHVHHDGLGRLFGAPSVALTSVRFDRLTVEGATVEFTGGPAPFTSRRSCAQCGTPLFVSTGAEEVCVTSATLDPQPLRVPAASLWADQARPWAPPDARLPAFGGPDGSEPLGIADLRARLNLAQPGVRLATRWDLFELTELFEAKQRDGEHALGAPAGLATTLARTDHWLLVSEDHGRLRGYCQLDAMSDSASDREDLVITELYVAPQHRRQGVASAFVAAARWLASAKGAARITLLTPETPPGLEPFALAMGFATRSPLRRWSLGPEAA